MANHDRRDPHRAPRDPLPRGHERILLLDDEPLVQKVHAIELRRLGYEVVCAGSGEEAIAWLRQHDADLILMDLLMPEMDGVEAFRRIRQFKPRQKALVYSGYASPARVAEVQALGAGPVILKPAPLSTLAAAVRAKLDDATDATGIPPLGGASDERHAPR